MKIKNIKVYNYTAGWREWSFIKIENDKKICGWAECTDTFKNLNGFCGILKDFKSLILGEDPLNIERIIWKLKAKSKSSPGSLIQRVISAVENALWDIKAKNVQKPVYELFGKRKRKEMEIYWSHCGTTRVRSPELLNKPPITSLKSVKNFCKEINKTDFKVIKTNLAIFKNGPQIYMPGHVFTFENPNLKLKKNILNEIINWIKELNTHLNKDIYIAVDLNFNFHTKDLIKIASSLKNFRIKWLEIDCRSPKMLVDLKKTTKIPIITGETIMEFIHMKEFIDQKCANYFSIDLPWNGLAESIKISKYCKQKNYEITTHNYNGFLGTLMSANFAAMVPNFFIGELDFDEADGVEKIFTDKPLINGRYLKIPSKPGWGCELIEKEINNFYSAKN